MPEDPVGDRDIPPPPREGEILAVLRSHRLFQIVQDGLRRIGAPPARLVRPSEALARLVGPGRQPLGLLCEAQPEAPGWGTLRMVAEDPFGARFGFVGARHEGAAA